MTQTPRDDYWLLETALATQIDRSTRCMEVTLEAECDGVVLRSEYVRPALMECPSLHIGRRLRRLPRKVGSGLYASDTGAGHSLDA
jgi:hypothetical protein